MLPGFHIVEPSAISTFFRNPVDFSVNSAYASTTDVSER